MSLRLKTVGFNLFHVVWVSRTRVMGCLRLLFGRLYIPYKVSFKKLEPSYGNFIVI